MNFFIEKFTQILSVSNNTLTLLSSTRATIVQAEDICSNVNGTFASLEAYGMKIIKPVLLKAFVKGKKMLVKLACAIGIYSRVMHKY